jgi:hypothetical protein
MKPAWNRGNASGVVLLMEREEEIGVGIVDWDEVPVTQRCTYVKDRESQKWIARAQADAEVASASAK